MRLFNRPIPKAATILTGTILLALVTLGITTFAVNSRAKADTSLALATLSQAPPATYSNAKKPSEAVQDLIEGQYFRYLQDKADIEYDLVWVGSKSEAYIVKLTDGRRMPKTEWLVLAQEHLNYIIEHLAKLDTHR